jgi:cell division protein FtsW
MNAVAARLFSLWAGPRRPAYGPVSEPAKAQGVDQPLIWVTLALLAFGMVMVYSASVALPDNPKFARYTHTYFLMRHVLFIGIALVAAMLAFQIPLATWQKAAPWLFIVSLVLLMLVLIPHVGKGVNGARRWIPLGFMSFQPSELAKLAVLMYAADYMVRKMDVKERFFRACPADGRGRGRGGLAAAGGAGHGRIHGHCCHRHGHPVPGRRQCANVLPDRHGDGGGVWSDGCAI